MLLLVLVTFNQSKAADELLTVHILDVGYADASLIQLPSNKIIMIDTGSRESQDHVTSYLKNKRIETIDAIILTHAHDNHYGGLNAIANAVRILKVYAPPINEMPKDLRALFNNLESMGISFETLKRGDVVPLDESVEIRILNPSAPVQEPNADSVVTQLNFKETALLFSGDITTTVQKKLLELKLLTKRPRLVLLPHHGDFLDPEFAQYIDSAFKVISTGPYDKWETPRGETLSLFTDRLYRTDIDHDLVFQTDGYSVKKLEFK